MIAFACPNVRAAIEVIGTRYQQDQVFPEWSCYWHDDCHVDVRGGNVHVYVKNTGGASVSITDVTLAGYSLKTVIAHDSTTDANSIFFYWNDPPADIMAAGDPAWYKADPTVIPPGGVAQAVMHLRAIPTTPTVSVGVVTTAGTVTTNVPIDATAPQLVSVGFSTNRSKVYLHWRRLAASGSAVPTTIKLDGVDVTAMTTTVSDPNTNFNFGVSVIHLAQPLDYMSYHVFQGVYANGKTATGSLRAWSHPFLYATWGTFPYADDNTTSAQNWITEATQHGFNAAQNQGIGGALGDYLGTSAGKAYADARGGYGVIIWQQGASANPLMSFLEDEPDAAEARLENNYCGGGASLPCGKSPMGVRAMREIAEGESYRAQHPLAPTTLNVDGSWRPLNYITWAHTVDVIQVDPYYQMRLQDAYDQIPSQIPLYLKATVIYAITKATVTGAEPNPAHPILFSTELLSDGTVVWPFPNRESKRIEVYYALAAGAKGLSYWWMNPGPKFNGMGNQNKPESVALWKEMGLLGNEIKIVAPLIVVSHPVDLPITPGPNVWAKACASGDDTLILYVVNDNYYNDDSWRNGGGETGFHYTPTANATVTVTLPAWMSAPMAFEITSSGLKAANTQLNGNQLQINLGTLQITRMVVLTKNPEVALLAQRRYDQQVRPSLCAFATEFCTNSAPAIVVPPQSQAAVLGDNVTFTCAASGYPLPTYQWRFFGTNLAGATGDTFTRMNAQANHAGNYTVVVNNNQGSVTSVVATLTVNTNGIAPSISIPPQSQTVAKGDNATFSVTANGTQPLSYQWRFNGGNLAGATGTGYTRFNAQTNDAGQYTVVVTNVAGAITSTPPATLNVTVPVYCQPVSLVNGSFETTNGTGIAVGWTGYQRSPNPTTVWTIQTASPPAGGGNNYQQIANTSSAGGGGVRQDINVVPGATYQIAGWFRGNSTLATCTVKVSPTASTTWATAVDLNPPQAVSTNGWTPFTGTVVATDAAMTLWLDGQTGSTGQNKAQCFDSVTVTCLGATAPPVLEASRQGGNLVFRWPTNSANYGLIAATNLGAVWNGVLPSPTVVNGTNVVTNAISGERKFYRLMRP